MLKRTDFFYELHEDLIAQTPIEPRDSSRMLCYNRSEDSITDKHFYDLVDYLNKGDLLVINTTRVIPARLFGTKVNDIIQTQQNNDITQTQQADKPQNQPNAAELYLQTQQQGGAKIEVFLLKRQSLTDFVVLIKPAKRLKTGTFVSFSPNLCCKLIEELDDGQRLVRFYFSGVFEQILDELGETPLPHYIHNRLDDKQRYQTVYARLDGSSAAPTAGLHFTHELLSRIKDKGVEICEVVLHVGIGTFRPVSVDDILQHKMHSEYFELNEQAALSINNAVEQKRRIIAVGTTSVRVLESCAARCGDRLYACSGETNIFIYPPYKFKLVDGLITNFHLPESTLIMLVSAFMGRENTLKAYNHAVQSRYRFFSFGDAMLIL